MLYNSTIDAKYARALFPPKTLENQCVLIGSPRAASSVLFESQSPWLHDGQVNLNNGVNRRQPNTKNRLIAQIHIGIDGPPCGTHCVTHIGHGLPGLVLFDAQGTWLDRGQIALKRKANRRVPELSKVCYTAMQAIYVIYIEREIESRDIGFLATLTVATILVPDSSDQFCSIPRRLG